MKNQWLKRSAVLAMLSVFAVPTTFAEVESALSRKRQYTYPAIYPFVPMDTTEILNDVERVTEDKNYIKNFNRIVDQGLSKAKAKRQPWTSSYWPLAKGTIADAYEDSKVRYYVDFIKTYKNQWKSTKKSFDKRVEKTLSRIDELSEEELDKLAPSEKYDLLLGDKSFDLTKRLMNYMYDYGADNYFYNLTDIHVTMDDTLEQAQNYVEWGWSNDIEDAIRNNFVLNKRLESRLAVKMLDRKQFTSADEALKAAMAQVEREKDNYVLADKKVRHIAAWEGICNGWSTAAGIIPRPRNKVTFTLDDGRKLNFYPDDIKGLVSQYWFNSPIQNNLVKDSDGNYQAGGTILVGNRCNIKNPKKDIFGRVYDSEPDPRTGDRVPRCVGVHPAKWHLALVNLIGKQGRSFIVERKVDDPVDNHPMHSYEMEYFNPNTGRSSDDPAKNIVEIDDKDQFKFARHKNAKYIVGVETTMTYLNYVKPRRVEEDSEEEDDMVDKKMLYDLELDKNYNIVGGQWRAVKVGQVAQSRSSRGRTQKLNHKQPDFFWVVTKDWKNSGLFNSSSHLPKWKDTSKQPPKEWLAAAKSVHEFEFVESTYMGTGRLCNVKHKETGEKIQVWCEHKTNRPQPLSNLVNTLVELSSGVKFEDF